MKKNEADVVVISAGTAGLAASVAAAEGGANVIALEKAGHTGGMGARASQIFAVESRIQYIKQYKLSREEAFKIFMDFMQWGVNARLVKAYIDKSASTLDWLEKMGVEFSDVGCHGPGMCYTAHNVKGHPRPGYGLAAAAMEILTDKARELGVQIYLKTPVRKLLKTNGRITGVIAEDKEGNTIQLKAKAVIIATGGLTQEARGVSVPAGDGIRMAREVEATINEGNRTTGGTPPGVMGGRTIMLAFSQPNLTVNLLGERFIDEEVMAINPFAPNAIARQKDQCAFCIFDEDTKRYYTETGFDFLFPPGISESGEPITDAKDLDAELESVMKKGSDIIFVADSIEELAEKAGINRDGLIKTIAEYNQACESGRDKVLNTKPRYLRPAKRPKFYAYKKITHETGSIAGIKVNHRTEVLTNDFEIIPGLYAAGLDSICNIYRDVYPNILPGNYMGWALNSGRIAAENALEYIKAGGQ
jgi:fumarate reductase flavoprotein subunit